MDKYKNYKVNHIIVEKKLFWDNVHQNIGLCIVSIPILSLFVAIPYSQGLFEVVGFIIGIYFSIMFYLNYKVVKCDWDKSMIVKHVIVYKKDYKK